MGANISIEGFNPLSSSTWIPVFGNYCGPGWSSGYRTDSPDWSILPITINGRPSMVDAACYSHDVRYSEAIGQPNEAYLILEADLQLRRDIAAMDFSSMTFSEKAYTVLMDMAFAIKIATVDLIGVVVEGIKNASTQLGYVGDKNGIGLLGQSYSDAQGNSFSCAQDQSGNYVLNCSEMLSNGTVVTTSFDEFGNFGGLHADTGSTPVSNLFTSIPNTTPRHHPRHPW